jgi:uncharacterized protein (TIGR01244 family)
MRRIDIRLRIAATLLAASAAVSTAALEEIDRFFRATDRVATAAQPTIPQLGEVRDRGFRTIVNLREPEEYDFASEEKAAADLGLRFVSIPVRTTDPKAGQLDLFLRVLEDPSIYPVFIHCGSGNRVGAFWMVRRILVDGWSAEDAETEARRIGMKSPNLKEFALEYLRTRAARP